MDQMLKSRNLAAFDALSRQTWEHSLQVAAIARVLARRIGRINQDEAMLAGMVHNIGVFYLLYRAAEYPEYRDNLEAVIGLVTGWQGSIGESLLQALGLPERIVESSRQGRGRPVSENPCSLADVVYFASLLAGDGLEWMPAVESEADAAARTADRERYADLLDEAAEDIGELRAALAA